MMKYGKQVIRIGFGKQEKEIESGVSVLHYVETKPSVLHDAFNILEHDVSNETKCSCEYRRVCRLSM